MKKTIHYSLPELPELVAQLKQLMQTDRIFAITGSLGAGKTTLVRSLLQACGVTGVISSPTFNYVNIYTTATGQKVYHFDLYRLHSVQEFIDAGFDEYLNETDAYIFIEWPEIIKELLFRYQVCYINLEYISEDKRMATIE